MSAASFKEAGNKHLQAGKFDEAIAAYTEAIELDPSDHVFYSNRSAAYLSKGDAENARLDAQDCILISPNWPKGYSRKGAALHALRRYDDAIAAFNQGLAIAPTDAGLLDGLANATKAKEAAEAAPPAGEGLFGPKMLAGLANHPKFGPKLKDPMFQMKLQMIQKNPQMMMQDPEMMELFQAILGQAGGKAEFGDDQPEDDYVPPLRPNNTPPSSSSAPSSSSSAPPKAPEPPKKTEPETPAIAAKERGNAHYKAKEFTQALAAYDEAISLDPANLMFLNNKAAVYIEMNQSDQAIAICQEILEKASSVKLSFDDRAKVWQRIAAAHLKKGDDKAAIDAYGKAQMEKYDKAIERKVKNLELEMKKKAIQDYINPELGLAAKERGNAAFRDGDFPKAIAEYEEAIKRDPTNAPYHNNLAAAYQKMGVFNDAKKAVEKSLELDKTYVKAWAKKGDIEFFMKEYHKAMDSYKTGLQLDPDNSLCRQGLQKTNAKVNELNYGGEHDKERTAHAMADPEIQRILSDPTIRQVLTDFQENPKFAQQALANDPDIRAKIEKLIAAGVLQVK